MSHTERIKMEDIYALHNDCVHNLSCLFSVDILISLSTTSQACKYFIFELLHCDKRLYYSNIYKFNKLQTLSVPKNFAYHDLSRLTQLKNILYRKEDFKQHITLLSNLRNCKYCDNHIYYTVISNVFHINLKSLEIFDSDGCPKFDIRKLSSFVNLTHINLLSLRNYNIESFLVHTNLKFLSTRYHSNLNVLTYFSRLEHINLFEKTNENLNFIFQHNNVTRIEIESIDNLIIENCIKLMKLTISSCKNVIIRNCNNIKKLSIDAFSLDEWMRSNLEKFSDVEYFSYYDSRMWGVNVSLSNFSRLSCLKWNCNLKPQLNEVVFNNIVKLNIFQVDTIFDLTPFTKLKYLHLINVNFSNCHRMDYLEKLHIHYNPKNTILIDLILYPHLIHLKLNNCKIKNLFTLTNLEVLNHTLYYIDMTAEEYMIFFNEIKLLSKLKSFVLHANYTEKVKIDVSGWLCCGTITKFDNPFSIDELKSLTNLTKLHFSCHDNLLDIAKLTRLIDLHLGIYADNLCINLEKLTRLEYVHHRSVKETYNLKIIRPIGFKQ